MPQAYFTVLSTKTLGIACTIWILCFESDIVKIKSSEGSGLLVHFQSNFGCCENLGPCTEKHCKNYSDNKNIE